MGGEQEVCVGVHVLVGGYMCVWVCTCVCVCVCVCKQLSSNQSFDRQISSHQKGGGIST